MGAEGQPSCGSRGIDVGAGGSMGAFEPQLVLRLTSADLRDSR